ncbi:hypothetical protein Adt_04596 [Abeliophyllum distichum]|uniref:Uncharacterized protein n=1 Tax=Abeliophyllum distichum TaxID=126358 RepID=A0ABD1V3M1_9LAMI
MGDFPPNNPNMPNQPTKILDFPSTMIGQPFLVNPSQNTSHTPPKSGLTLSNSPPFAETLGVAPSVATAPSNGYPSPGKSPLDAPPLGDLIGRSIAPQSLAPAVLPSDLSRRAMPTPSVPMAAIGSSLLSDMTHTATLISSHMGEVF